MTGTQKISELPELVTKASGDLLVIVDIDDLTDGSSGTTKKIQTVNLVGAGGLGDVVGPASAIGDNITLFDLNTGKLIKDSGVSISAVNANTAKVSYPGSASAAELNILDGATLSTTELNYVTGVTSAIQTQLNAKGTLSNVSEDTTPDLGGDLDYNSNGVKLTSQTVGGSNGNAVRLSGSNTWSTADASAESTCKTALGIRISATDVLVHGVYTTSGLTAGSLYYVSETAGAITTTAPSTSLSIVRPIAYALTTTELYVFPSGSYVEVA
jgi:hypothetical protein